MSRDLIVTDTFHRYLGYKQINPYTLFLVGDVGRGAASTLTSVGFVAVSKVKVTLMNETMCCYKQNPVSPFPGNLVHSGSDNTMKIR